MAKEGMKQRELKRKKLAQKHAGKRERLLSVRNNKEASPEDRFKAQLALTKLPPNSAKNRQRNRCALTGRPRGYHRRFNISRIMLRELASRGELPGVTKSSW